MARNKKNQDSIPQDTPDEIQNAEPQGSDIAGNEPEFPPASSPVLETVLPDKIQNVDQAKEWVKQKYKVPAGVKLVHVTTDRNVFFDKSYSSGVDHAVKNNIQIFSFRWD